MAILCDILNCIATFIDSVHKRVARCSVHSFGNEYSGMLLLMLTSFSFSFVACKEQPQKDLGVFHTTSSSGLDLDVIQQNGELIAVAMYGQDTYFEHLGEGFGAQYMIAREFARSIGCTIRLDVMPDSASMIHRLDDGEADVALFPNTEKWVTRADAPQLKQTLHQWVKDNRENFVAMTTIRVYDERGRVYAPRRHVYSPVLNASLGQISQYDNLFRKYAAQCGWDWRLLAAQSYQESAFDANAVSSMGALGLMQLMPRTAASLGISVSQAFNPETNLSGAARYITRLNQYYSGIADPNERICFVLAAYNGGEGHIDDARRLAKKMGRDADRWSGGVDLCVLHLSESRYYNDPDVRHGYMRGSETYNYVADILSRWRQYQGIR
mgnify:CR=1 FL=1